MHTQGGSAKGQAPWPAGSRPSVAPRAAQRRTGRQPVRSPGGGFTVAQHVAHMVAVTKFWGSLIDAERLEPLPDLADDDGDSFVAEQDLGRIRAVLERTAAAARAASEAHPEGASESPHADADSYLVHMLVHDAHHRGQILLALKTSGHPLPDEEALWAPWRS